MEYKISRPPPERIQLTAELDALVAHSYNLTRDEYAHIISSFKSFKRNPALYDLDEITWDNNNLKEFHGEVGDLALEYYENIPTQAEIEEAEKKLNGGKKR